MSSKCAVMEVAPPARSRSIDFRSAAAASSRYAGSIENPEISAGPNRTVPMIRPSFLTEKWDRCSSGGSARYRSRWIWRSLVGRSVRPETNVRQYAWASVVCKGSRLTGTPTREGFARHQGSRAEILSGRRPFDTTHGFRAHGDPSDHAQDGPRFRGAGDHPPIPRLRREPGVPVRVGQEDGRARAPGRLRAGEVRGRGTRHRVLCDYDRGTFSGRCERRGDCGRVQRPRLRTAPSLWDRRPEAKISRAGGSRRMARRIRAHGTRT